MLLRYLYILCKCLDEFVLIVKAWGRIINLDKIIFKQFHILPAIIRGLQLNTHTRMGPGVLASISL